MASMPDKITKRCSFCDKPENEVKSLVGCDGGPHICNKCVGSCVQALEHSGKAEEAEKEKPLRKPKEIVAFLDEYIISQDAAKTDVAVAIYNHYKRRGRVVEGFETVEIKKSNIVMAGPSGTGKTEIARVIARMLNVPFYVFDATKLTAAGYVGDDVETIIQRLVADAGGDIERAEWGIVVIDEGDKLARKSGRDGSGYRDIAGEGAQQALLKLLEGTVVDVPRGNAKFIASDHPSDMVDTANILFIVMGSFSGIEDCVKKRVNKNARIGFGGEGRKELGEHEVYANIIEEDLLEFGLIPELTGRLPILTSCMPLTEDEMVRILTEPRNAIIKQFQALFAIDGVDLQFDEDALRAIGREANERPTGARALRSVVEKVLKPYALNCPSDPTIKTVLITEAVVEGEAEATIVRETEKAPEPLLAKA